MSARWAQVAKLAFGRDPDFQEHAPNGSDVSRIWCAHLVCLLGWGWGLCFPSIAVLRVKTPLCPRASARRHDGQKLQVHTLAAGDADGAEQA